MIQVIEMSHSITLTCELCPVNIVVERQCRKSKSKATSNPVCILPLGYAYMDFKKIVGSDVLVTIQLY